MDDSQKMDQELLQFPPRVDTSTFPKTSAKRIAQAHGRYIYRNCMFAAMKKSLQVRHSRPGESRDKDRELPYYPIRYFHRQVVHWMAVNHQRVMHYMGPAIRATYDVADPTASHGGPFSYATYLRKLLKKQFWGDEIMLWSISMMWGLKISVLNSKTL